MTDASPDRETILAQRAVERGWVTKEQVEATILQRTKDPSRTLLQYLPLSADQVRELEGPVSTVKLPDEVSRLLSDPASRVGKYVVVARLGAGGMGMVLRAYDTVLHRWVALKVLKALGDETARQYFDREARLAAGLSHPNIAAIYDVGEHEGQPFIAMQLIEGENLQAARKRMALPQVIEAMRRIADAVRFAHERKVIHRDLKPANVMIDARDRIFVMDFGLAKESAVDGQSLGGSDVVVGTAQYMAPEQAKGKADEQSDVYGLGAILYEMVTGRPPFVGETTADVLLQVTNAEPVWPRKLNPAVPREVEAIILHCLEKERRRRYGSVQQLAEDLDAFARGNPLRHARRPTIGYILAKKIRKQPLLWALAAASMLGVVGAIGWLVERSYQLSRIQRLSDETLLGDLQAEARGLWPAVPEKAEAMTRWLAKAEELAGRLPVHRAHLRELEKKDLTDPAVRWEHEKLAKLVAGLEVLSSREPPAARKGSGLLPVLDGSETVTLGSVRSRVEFALTVEGRSVRADWEGVGIEPQLGLVPIGRDPQSGLWEFADLQTGEPAVRGADGRLTLKPETGLVFVLIPAGKFRMGAGDDDKDAQENERPVREISLDSFLLSKYEMTQAQWERFTGENPSQQAPPKRIGGKVVTWLHPVESVSWDDCSRVLRRLGLALSTEAQWEYAARAGTATPFWTGGAKETLQGAANVGDRAAERSRELPLVYYDGWLDDGYTGHAPVGTYRPNPFGLHEIVGNVWTWCRDAYDGYEKPVRAGDGECITTETAKRVLRGSGFRGNVKECRSAFRGSDSPGSRLVGLGVRPMREVAGER